MAVENFFKRVIIPVRQRPISADLNRLQERMLETSRLIATGAHCTSGAALTSSNADIRTAYNVPHAFQGGSFLVRPDPAATPFGIMLQPGYGYSAFSPNPATDYDSANGLDIDTNNNWSPFVLSAYQTGLTVPAPPAGGSSRIDIIEVKTSYLATNPQTVGIFNTATEVFDPATRNKDLTWDMHGRIGTVTSPASSTMPISYKTGVAAVGDITVPAVPATTSGYTKIAQINVVGGATAINQHDIVDFRRSMLPNGILHVAGQAIIPGVLAGIGGEDFTSMEVPPGITIKMAYQNNVAPSAGTSYNARFYIIGGDIWPLTNQRIGCLVASPVTLLPRCVAVASTVTTLALPDLDILGGSDPNWTVVNGTHSFPYAQTCAILDIQVKHPAGSALSSTETFNFQYTLSLA